MICFRMLLIICWLNLNYFLKSIIHSIIDCSTRLYSVLENSLIFHNKVLYHLNSIPHIPHHNFLTVKILVYTLHQMDLTSIYRTFHPTICSHGTYSRIGHIIKHKYVLANLRRSKSYQLSGQNDIELEINKSLSGKSTKMWKLNSTLPKNQWVKKEIKSEL